MRYRTPIHIVDAKRSPIGRLGGCLAPYSAVELALLVGGPVLPPDRQAVDQVILGQVLQAGSGMNLARQVALGLDLPLSVPGYTVNMVCGSGLKAVALGAGAVEIGESEVVLCGGAESMTQAPHILKDLRSGKKFGAAPLLDIIEADGLTDPRLNILMGETAERVADRYGISRVEQDEWSVRSQELAVSAREAFRREIVPILAKDQTIDADEHPRPGTTVERLGKLKPVFRKEGTVTAGNASGLNDGAAALLLASESGLSKVDAKSRARIVGSAAVGCEPEVMGLGPVGAIRQLCQDLGWNLSEVDAVEINEAFAAQTIGCARELGLNLDRLNVRGGAIALGHPIGASGARVLVTLLHILEDKGWRRGIASLCIGGGMGIAVGIEIDD